MRVKELLEDLEQVQRKEEMQDLMLRVHDLMGQRISLLQRLAASGERISSEVIGDLMEGFLENLRFDATTDPRALLQELTSTYHGVGIMIRLYGDLPKNAESARLFFEILREALNNAVRHGHADEVHIYMEEHRIYVEDNGIGSQEMPVFGNGLNGIAHRLRKLGGCLVVTSQPHFAIDARILEQ